MVVQLFRFTTARCSLMGVSLFVLQLICVVRTTHVVVPYLYATASTYPALSYTEPIRFLVMDISGRAESEVPAAVATLLEMENPSVVIVLRHADLAARFPARDRYPFSITSSLHSDRVVEIVSKVPFHEPIRSEFGYGALPAVFGVLEVGEGARLQLGALDLLPAYSQDFFVKSRLTSRRLASSLRYSAEPRMVVGAFRASVTSQIVDMYVDQLRLRSLFFDSGFSKLGALVAQSFAFEGNLNVFSARTIEVSRVIESRGAGAGFSALLFDARIPKMQ
jgi:hypothetical protein